MKAKPAQSLERSLRRHLFWGLLVVLLMVLSLVHLGLQQLTKEFVAARLLQDAEGLLSALVLDADQRLQLDPTRVSDLYQRAYSGHYFAITTPSQVIRSRSLWDIDIAPFRNQTDSRGAPTPTLAHWDGPKDQQWLSLELRVEKQQQALRIWISEDISPLGAAQRRFELSLLALLAVAIALLLLLQKFIITREMSVFNDVQQSLKAMQGGAELVFPSAIPLEIAGLVTEIEHALRQSVKQLKRSRTAVGNLAHELKRPLQQLRWLAQQHPEASTDLLAVFEQLQGLVTRELRRAAIAGNPSPGQRFNPSADLPVIGQLLARQNPNGIDLQLHLPPGLMPFERDDMLELLGNLLDNAWRFAATLVVVSIAPRADGQGWECTVDDDGPGLSAADYQLLSQRGVSRDESGGEHHGLGLHICWAVVDSYGGQLSMRRSDLGGLQIHLSLPSQAQSD